MGTWGYELNHELGDDNWLCQAQGVCHAAELRFMWNNLDDEAPEVNKGIANTMGLSSYLISELLLLIGNVNPPS